MRRRTAILSLLAVFAAGGVLLALAALGVTAPIDRRAGDLLVELDPAPRAPRKIAVIVAFDTPSLDPERQRLRPGDFVRVLEALADGRPRGVLVLPPFPGPTDAATALKIQALAGQLDHFFIPDRVVGTGDERVAVPPWSGIPPELDGEFRKGVSQLEPDADGFVRRHRRTVTLRDPAAAATAVSVEWLLVDRNDIAEFGIHYTGGAATEGSIVRVPARKVVQGQVPPSYFHDKYVIIAATAPVLAERGYPVPPSGARATMDAAEIHAQALETLYARDGLSPLPLAPHGVWLLGIGLLTLLFLAVFGVRYAGFIVPVLLFGAVVAAFFAYQWGGYLTPPLPTLWMLLGTTGWAIGHQFRMRPKKLAHLVELVRRRPAEWYRPPEVAKSDVRFYATLAEYLETIVPEAVRVDFWETAVESPRLKPAYTHVCGADALPKRALRPPDGFSLHAHPFREALVRPGKTAVTHGLITLAGGAPAATRLILAHTPFQILGVVALSTAGDSQALESAVLQDLAEPLGRQFGLAYLRKRLQLAHASSAEKLGRRLIQDPVAEQLSGLELLLSALLRERGLLLRIIDGLPVGIGVFDLLGRQEGLNAEARQVLAAVGPTLVSTDLPELLAALRGSTPAAEVAALQELLRAHGRLEHRLSVEAQTYAAVVHPILSTHDEEEQPLGFALTLLDVTSHEHLAQYKAEVARLVSFKMKTAVTEILGAAEVIAMEAEESGDETVAEFADVLNRKSAELETVLEEFFAIAEATGTEIPRDARAPLDVQGVIDAVVLDLRAQMPDLTLAVDAPTRLNVAVGDRLAFEDVVRRVLGYVLEVVPPRAPVRLALTEKPERIVLDVQANLYLAPETVRVLELGVDVPETIAGAANFRELARTMRQMGGDVRFLAAPSGEAETWNIRLTLPKY